jgi:hypothetical protein
VVQVEAREGVELRARHRRLVDERPGLEEQDAPAGRRELRRDDPAAGAGAHDDDVGLELHRRGGRRGRPVELEDPDRRRLGGDGRAVRLVGDGRERARLAALGVRRGDGVGEEAEELPERLEPGALQADRRAGPAEEEPLALVRGRSDRSWAAGGEEIDDRDLEQPEDESELLDLGRVGGAHQGFGRQQGDPGPVGRRDERLGDGGERPELAGRERSRRLAPGCGRGGQARPAPAAVDGGRRSKPWAGSGSQRSGRSSR